MAGRLADSVQDALNDTIWRAASFTALPATVYLGLSTTTPTSSGGSVTEPTDANYARVAVTRSSGNFNASASRQTTNAATFTWPTPTSGGSGYGGIMAVPIYSAATGGTYLGCLLVTGGPVTVGAGIPCDIPAGSLTWTAANS